MYNKNYLTVGKYENAVGKNWCLSVKSASPLEQVKVKLNNDETYNYISRYCTETNDVAIVGYIMNEDNEPCGSTGQMGLVDGKVAKKLTRSRTADLDFVFSPNCDMEHIDACVKYLKVKCDAKAMSAYRTGVRTVYPITMLIRKLLAAVTVVAHPDLVSQKQLEMARNYLQDMYEIPEEVKAMTYEDVVGYSIRDKKVSWSKEDIHVYKESGKISASNAAVFKYIHIGAISVMVRGGFVNLLKAYLGANPPIKEFYKTILEEATQVGAPEAIALLKEYKPVK